jgi:hypothetical protein
MLCHTMIHVSVMVTKLEAGVYDTTLCDKSLSVTCDMSVVFSGHSGFLHQ